MDLPEMIPVLSSHIKSIGYKPDEEELYVEFKDNSIYVYKNVPEIIWEDFQMAESKGVFLAQKIKGIYPYEKIL